MLRFFQPRDVFFLVVMTLPLTFRSHAESDLEQISCPYLLMDAAYGEAFKADLTQVIRNSSERLNKLVPQGIWSPQRARIYEKLGFSFDPVSIRVPDPAEFYGQYEKLVREMNISADSRLLPVRIFRDGTGKMKVLKPFRLPPRDWIPDANPVAHSEYERLVSQGFFPLFEPRDVAVRDGTVSFTWHDIGHLIGWLQFPEYAKAFREGVGAVKSLPAGTFEFGSPVGSRLNFVLEWMAYPRVSREELIHLLDIPVEFTGRDQVTVKELKAWLNEKPGRVTDLHARYLKNWPSLIDFYGGAIDDGMIFRIEKGPLNSKPYRATFDRRFGSYSGLLENFLEFQNEIDGRANRLARVYAHLLQLSSTTPGQLVREAIQPRVDPKSSFYRLFCGTGIVIDADVMRIMGCKR